MLHPVIFLWIAFFSFGCAEKKTDSQPNLTESSQEQSQTLVIEFLDSDSVTKNILTTTNKLNWSIESILLLDTSAIEAFSAIDPIQVKEFRELVDHITPRVFIDSVHTTSNSLKECFLNPVIREKIVNASLLDKGDYRLNLLSPRIYIKDDNSGIYELNGGFWWQTNRITLSDSELRIEFIYSIIE